MQPHAHRPEFQKRFDCQSSSNTNEKLTHEELEKQINTFLQRGGSIKEINSSIGAVAHGAVIVGETPESMGTPRPRKSCNNDHELLSITMAAKLINKSRSWITRRVADGAITVAVTDKSSGAKLLKRTDVLALPL
ncbi:hypothetical protein D0C16_05605 [Cellvibrio sp. KY-GH-1]|uniref:hypothetical protein n=1 Tax=Cellvibrio sp. KY-GH-1 TaxID=2303332 RepID=UPI001243F9DF|nr:hypothetical protein [Cellvibrio sp. KY-GH-1]QEY15496.1 hypothetical protein D0C16_05605 [Cellvibrio sp. KY-GH-1]